MPQGEQLLVMTAYPLRAIRLHGIAARLLPLCTQAYTCEQLAQLTGLTLKRVETTCEQLRWRGLLDMGAMLPPPSWPAVSVIIPSYNRARELERCLLSLFQQNYPAPIEILVVDDASTDETASMVKQLITRAPQHITLRLLHHVQRQGIGRSRNSGAEAAQHELLAYIDSDCVASPTWLYEIVPVFQQPTLAAAGGMIRAYERQSLFGRYEDARSSLFMGGYTQQVRPEGPLTYLPTANLLVRRSIWQQLGGFAPLSLGEDVDFCRRLLQTGASMRYLAQGVVYHDYRTTLFAFLRTRAAYASSEAMLLQRFPTGRRVLLLPTEQASFAALSIGSLWSSIHYLCVGTASSTLKKLWPITMLILTCLFTLFSTNKRHRTIRKQRIPFTLRAVFVATLRGHGSYTYHLCRHLTRYYTLPALLIFLLLPPFLPLILIPCTIVIGIDYLRLRPDMGFGEFALCALLDDCAYEVGVMQGCIRHRTWKPLIPLIRVGTTDRP